MNIEENLVDDCKKFLGRPPYDTWTNITIGDPYFYAEICKRYGKQNVLDTIKRLNI